MMVENKVNHRKPLRCAAHGNYSDIYKRRFHPYFKCEHFAMHKIVIYGNGESLIF